MRELDVQQQEQLRQNTQGQTQQSTAQQGQGQPQPLQEQNTQLQEQNMQLQEQNAQLQGQLAVLQEQQQGAAQETIRIKYHSDKIERLTYIDGKSDWIDLRSAENVTMKQGEFRLINLGISMQLPKGYEAVLVPRSSTYKNFGIIQTNHMGVVDETFCGDKDVWRMPVLAMRDTRIQVNDRICQFRIQKHQPRIVFEEAESLGNPSRGGFGSTGKR